MFVGYRNREEIISARFREVRRDKTAPKVTVGLLPPSPGFRLPTSSGCSTTLSPGLIAKLWCLNCKEAAASQSQDDSLSNLPNIFICVSRERVSSQPLPAITEPLTCGNRLLCAPGLPPLVVACMHLCKPLLSELCVLMYSVPSVFPPNPGLIHSVHVFW